MTAPRSTNAGWWVYVPGLFDGEWYRLSGPYEGERAARDYAAQFCAIWRVRHVA